MRIERTVKKAEARHADELLDPPEVPARTREAEAPAPRRRRSARFAAAGIVAICAAIYGGNTIAFYMHHIETDDAQLEGHIYPVLPKIAGYVTDVSVHDNQALEAAQVVVRIDSRDLLARIRQAEAELENARAAVAVAHANVTIQATRRTKTATDVHRYDALREKAEISPQEFDAAKASADAAGAEVEAASRQVTAAEADVAQKQAALERRSSSSPTRRSWLLPPAA